MNPRIVKAVAEEITSALRGYVDTVARGLDEVRAMVRDIPAGPRGVGIKSITQAEDLRSAEVVLDDGQSIALQLPAGPQGVAGEPGAPGQGSQGEPGIGIKSITQTDDHQTLGIEFDNGETVEVKLPLGPRGFTGEAGTKGDTGAPGAPGADGRAPSAAEVAEVLRASPEFVQAATPETLQAAPWKAGIYRSGSLVAHYIGRLYCAAKDTTDEPGDSPDWQRIGTQGERHTGGYSDTRTYEPGDYYAKNGGTFVFDGAHHRLVFAKPYTEAEAEKAIAKALEKALAKASSEHSTELRARDANLAETKALARQALDDLAVLRNQLQELLE